MFSLLTNVTLFDKVLHCCFQTLPGEQLFDSLISRQYAGVSTYGTGMKRLNEFGLQSSICGLQSSICSYPNLVFMLDQSLLQLKPRACLCIQSQFL